MSISVRKSGPLVHRFPVGIHPGFAPLQKEIARRWDGKACPAEQTPYRVMFGGGFNAKRGAHLHRALDIMAPIGAMVRAPSDGRVLETWEASRRAKRPGAGWSERGGWYVTYEDGSGYEWYLAHMLRRPEVGPGDLVKRGQWLGLVGRSGNASRQTASGIYGCPHLHIRCQYGASPRGKKLDVLPLFRPLLADAYRGPWPKDVLRLTGAKK
jgi:murein DD-endopeptidase MepM/ murein hydrolase activator NlpD